MKISKSQLKQIIKEELEKELEEGAWGDLKKVAGIGLSPEEQSGRNDRLSAIGKYSDAEQEVIMKVLSQFADSNAHAGSGPVPWEEIKMQQRIDDRGRYDEPEYITFQAPAYIDPTGEKKRLPPALIPPSEKDRYKDYLARWHPSWEDKGN
jgi:hypothetical protein